MTGTLKQISKHFRLWKKSEFSSYDAISQFKYLITISAKNISIENQEGSIVLYFLLFYAVKNILQSNDAYALGRAILKGCTVPFDGHGRRNKT